MRKFIQFISVAALAAISAAHAADGVREGQWEYTNTMKMPGMAAAPKLPAGMKLPGGLQLGADGGMSMSFKHCVTADNARPPMKDESKYKCVMTKEKRSGGHFEWAQHCTGTNTDFTSEGSAVYTGDTMSSQMNSKGTMEGRPAEMSMNTTGKYLGACPGT